MQNIHTNNQISQALSYISTFYVAILLEFLFWLVFLQAENYNSHYISFHYSY